MTAMPRATRVIAAADRRERPISDTLILDYAQRSAQAFNTKGLKGGTFELALTNPAACGPTICWSSTTANCWKWWRRRSR